MVLGTVSYMSPEQAAGQKVDARTDLFSLGVVLYEMLTGHRPFEGRTRNHVLVAILDEEAPPLSSYLATAPVELESIINRALRKDRAQRYQTAQELFDDLKRLKRELELQTSAPASGAVTSSKVTPSTGKIKLRQRAALTISAALVLGLVAIAFWLYRPSGQSKPATPFQPMQITRLNTPRRALDAAISPDGKHVAYVTGELERQTVWLKQLATNSDTQLIPPAELSYRWLTFSPDGNYLYFVANKEPEPRALYQMPALGGPARKLPVRLRTPFSFSPDGKRLAFVRASNDGESALIVADVAGSEEQKLAARKQPEWFSYRGPAWSPDGKVIACSVGNVTDRFSMTTVAVRVADGTVSPLTARQWPGLHRVAWLRDGSGLVMVISEQISWEPQQLWFLSYPDGAVRKITNDLSNYSQYHLSLTADSSALLALKADTVCNIWVAPDSARSQAKQLTFGSAGRGDGFYGLAWTPDGKLVYSSFVSNNETVFLMKADGTEARQLMTGDHRDRVETVTRDGRHILFQSTRTGKWNIWRMDLDGNNPKQLTNGANELNPHCSPDGKWLFYESQGGLYKVALEGGEPIRLFEQSAAYPAVSPDGKLVAFPYFDYQVNTRRVAVISAETGQLVKTFDFGYYWNHVRWTPDGRAVAYIKTQGDVANIWAQPLDGGKAVQLTDFKSDLIFNFAWSNDGKTTRRRARR
jgi:Tol biopolymer transport system component